MQITVRLFLLIMMIKKYKIGNFTAEIKSQADFQDVEPYSLFLYDGEQIDYSIEVEFSSDLPQKIENPYCVSHDRVYVWEDNILHTYYKSHDIEEEFYASRTVDGNNIKIVIDERYHDLLRSKVLFALVGIEELIAEKNGCVLHSSFVEKDGEAILFVGPCSIGKSTQANLWKKYADAVVINGDKALVYEKDGNFYASGIPFSGSSKDCLNKVLPLKAIISLEQAETNSAKKLASTEAFLSLYKNCYPVPYSRDCTGELIDFIEHICQSVPVYDYACVADESAVRYLERILCRIIPSL